MRASEVILVKLRMLYPGIPIECLGCKQWKRNNRVTCAVFRSMEHAWTMQGGCSVWRNDAGSHLVEQEEIDNARYSRECTDGAKECESVA